MKQSKIVITFASMVLFAVQANASINTYNDASNCPSCGTFFLELGSGASFPNNAQISPDTSIWDATPQGYNGSLSTEPLYMAGFGYKVNPLISFDISGTYRGNYQYQKFQTSQINAINLLGNKTRYFNLSSTSILFNTTIYGEGISKNLVWNTGSVGFIQPFLGAGLGVSYNTVSNFHSVLANGNTTSTMDNNTVASFAYQFNAGLEWQYKRVALDVGYRYFNAGNFESNNHITSPNAAVTNVPPWKSTLDANEVFLTLKVSV